MNLFELDTFSNNKLCIILLHSEKEFNKSIKIMTILS